MELYAPNLSRKQRNALSARAKVILNPKYKSKLGIKRANIKATSSIKYFAIMMTHDIRRLPLIENHALVGIMTSKDQFLLCGLTNDNSRMVWQLLGRLFEADRVVMIWHFGFEL